MKKDFFISYTAQDTAWAEWIAWQLEEAGYTTVLQHWDMGPGSNFVVEMHQRFIDAERMVLVLSPAFLPSRFPQAEWASAFARDPTGQNRLLLPVMVEDCDPPGLLSQIVHIRLAGLSESDARTALLSGIGGERLKPSSAPGFPGAAAAVKGSPPPFPFGLRSFGVATPSPAEARDIVLAIFQRLADGRQAGHDRYLLLDRDEGAFLGAFEHVRLSGTLSRESPLLELAMDYAHHFLLTADAGIRSKEKEDQVIAAVDEYYRRNSTAMNAHPLGARYHHLVASRHLYKGRVHDALESQRRAASLADVRGMSPRQRLGYEKCVQCIRAQLLGPESRQTADQDLGELARIERELSTLKMVGSDERRAILYTFFFTAMAKAKTCIYTGRFGESELGAVLEEAERRLRERDVDKDSQIDRALLHVYRAVYLAERDEDAARACLDEAMRYWKSVPVRFYCLLQLPEAVTQRLNWIRPGWLPA